jgi:hypothetical protein
MNKLIMCSFLLASGIHAAEISKNSTKTEIYNQAYDLIAERYDYKDIKNHFETLHNVSQDGLWRAYNFIRKTEDDTTLSTLTKAYTRARQCNDIESIKKFELHYGHHLIEKPSFVSKL